MLQRFFTQRNPCIPAPTPPRSGFFKTTFQESGICEYSSKTIVIIGRYNCECDRQSSMDFRACALIAIHTSLPLTTRTTDLPITALKAGLTELCSSRWQAHFDFKSVTLRHMHSNTLSLRILAAKRSFGSDTSKS